MITDKAAIFGSKIDLHLLTSGHYCVDIVPKFTSNGPSEESNKKRFTDSLDMLHYKNGKN